MHQQINRGGTKKQLFFRTPIGRSGASTKNERKKAFFRVFCEKWVHRSLLKTFFLENKQKRCFLRRFFVDASERPTNCENKSEDIACENVFKTFYPFYLIDFITVEKKKVNQNLLICHVQIYISNLRLFQSVHVSHSQFLLLVFVVSLLLW